MVMALKDWYEFDIVPLVHTSLWSDGMAMLSIAEESEAMCFAILICKQ
jgi:hypothetical protein